MPASSPRILPSIAPQILQMPPFQLLDSLWTAFYNLPRPFKVLTVVGALYTTSLLTCVGDFIWLHLLRPSDLRRYQHPPRLVHFAPPKQGKASSKHNEGASPASDEASTDVVAVPNTEYKPEQKPIINPERTKTSTPIGQAAAKQDEAWAVVTGATSGIGLGYAAALLDKGFNVIIHGRNRAKLERVRDDLLARFPTRSIETLIIDAEHCFSNASPTPTASSEYLDPQNSDNNNTTTSASTSTTGRNIATSSPSHSIFDPIRQRFHNHNITLLINNLGGPGTLDDSGLCTPHSLRPTSHTLAAVSINILFPLELTRAFLPILERNTPSLIINVGSASGRLPMPLLGVHGAVKAFQEAWARSLAAEMRFLRGKSAVKVRYDLVGMCATPGAGAGAGEGSGNGKTWLRPDGAEYARASLALGSAESWWARRDVGWGYWPHGLVFGGVIGWVMPGWVREWVVGGIVKGMVEDERRARGEKRKG